MINYSGEPLAVVVADDLSDDFNYSNGEIKVNFPAQQDTSIYALKNGDANEPFKVKDATNDNEAVNKGQLKTTVRGFKNILINGEFKVNQRQANSKTETVNAYNYDRWYYDGSNLIQKIEEVNYKPNTVYTLSGTNVTTTQLTSPSSGIWEITVPTNANTVQLEEGTEATVFENRPIGLELSLCQRYYEENNIYGYGIACYNDYFRAGQCFFAVQKRAVPTITLVSFTTDSDYITFGNFQYINVRNAGMYVHSNSSSELCFYADAKFKIDAEL